MGTNMKYIFYTLIAILVILTALVLSSLPILIFWNWFLSPVFGINCITVFQSTILMTMFYFILASLNMFSGNKNG
tara:strand:+ start:152 stop:376 length:225 start_codon:yes stop_codon:yes gene_type:complete